MVRAGCMHGTCEHPHDCLCGPGTDNENWTGTLCNEPICKYVVVVYIDKRKTNYCYYFNYNKQSLCMKGTALES